MRIRSPLASSAVTPTPNACRSQDSPRAARRETRAGVAGGEAEGTRGGPGGCAVGWRPEGVLSSVHTPEVPEVETQTQTFGFPPSALGPSFPPRRGHRPLIPLECRGVRAPMSPAPAAPPPPPATHIPHIAAKPPSPLHRVRSIHLSRLISSPLNPPPPHPHPADDEEFEIVLPPTKAVTLPEGGGDGGDGGGEEVDKTLAEAPPAPVATGPAAPVELRAKHVRVGCGTGWMECVTRRPSHGVPASPALSLPHPCLHGSFSVCPRAAVASLCPRTHSPTPPGRASSPRAGRSGGFGRPPRPRCARAAA